MLTPVVETAYREQFVCWSSAPGEDYPYDHDHAAIASECDWGWICNLCPRRVDDGPCREHAPIAVPGLRLVECQAEPPHLLFAHDREDYGHGCPWCWYMEARKQLDVHEWCKHKAWRRWRAVHWLVRTLPLTGYGHDFGKGCHSCLITTSMRWRWS